MSTSAETIYIDPERDPLTWAQRYAKRGWHMVILHGLNADLSCTCSKGADCRSAGKHPLARAWQDKATTNYEEIADQISGNNVNLGIATGHGLVVLDVDGELGMESLEQLMAEHKDDFKIGPMARTGSGGLHLFFKTEEQFTNKVKMLPGLDIRSYGGQVVACPSRHRSGSSYVWEGPFDVDVPQLPEWLATIFRGHISVEFDIQAWLKKQPPCISGDNGSAQLMSVIGRVIRDGNVRNFDQFARVFATYNAMCVPPWSESELEHAWDNAFKRFASTNCVSLPINKEGHVVCTRSHLHMILAQDPNYEFSFSYNSRSGGVYYNDAPMGDNDVRAIELDICNRYCLRDLKRAWLEDSIALRGGERSFDPVVDYLSRLHWDGYERIPTAVTRLLKCEDSPLSSSILTKWMIGTVARAFEPGCQMDTVLVLKGAQGILKSSWFRAMAGAEFYDSTRLDLKNKDVYQQLSTWILEWAELTNVRQFDNELVKAFITSRKDTYRLPYARRFGTHERKGVIVGSTNARDFLSDPTGWRRYWVLECLGMIDLKQTLIEKDQLWAEAVHRYRAGDQWHFTSQEQASHNLANARFEVEDLIYWQAYDVVRYGPDRVYMGALALQLLGKITVSGHERDSITRALRDAGFERGFVMDAGRLKRGWLRVEKHIT